MAKAEKVKVYAYITSVAFITNIPTFIYFAIEARNLPEKYEDFSIKFEFEGKFKTRTNKSSKTIKANTSDSIILESDIVQLNLDEILFDLKIKCTCRHKSCIILVL